MLIGAELTNRLDPRGICADLQGMRELQGLGFRLRQLSPQATQLLLAALSFGNGAPAEPPLP